MRKVTFIMLALTIMGGIFTSCKKEKKNETEPTTTENTVTYELKDHIVLTTTTVYVSEFFSYDFTYIGADGKAVEVKDAKAGWKMEIKVKAPFTAKMEGKIKFNESDVPEKDINFSSTLANISYQGNYSSSMDILTFNTKAKFMDFISNNPEELDFSETLEIK